jgi:hypothetical protein
MQSTLDKDVKNAARKNTHFGNARKSCVRTLAVVVTEDAKEYPRVGRLKHVARWSVRIDKILKGAGSRTHPHSYSLCHLQQITI